MRSTSMIDDDLTELLQDTARRTGRTYRDVLNQAIRDGLLNNEQDAPCSPPVHELGIRSGIDLTKALQITGQLEDENFARFSGVRYRNPLDG